MAMTGKQTSRILRQTWLVVLLAFIGSSPGNAEDYSGHLKLGVWPRHNEDILNAHSEINKFRFELSEKIRIRSVELELNPVFIFGGNWPKLTTTYNYDWINAEYNFIFRYFILHNTNVYYHKKLYRDIYNKTGSNCNCTYSDEVGLEYKW